MRTKFRPFTLMEILIAVALITLCAIPLLQPHYVILKQERQAVRHMEWDRLAGVVYGDLVRDFYKERIFWDEIEMGQELPVESELLKEKKLQVTRRISIERSKPKEHPSHYLLHIVLTFEGKKSYDYYLYVERPVYAQQAAEEET